MKKIFLCLAMLVSIPCFALSEEDEMSAPMHYAIEPFAGYHLAFSKLSGSNGFDNGFLGGVGFRFMRDGYFFTPNVKLVGIVGLDKSPLTMFTYGFTTGGRILPGADLFVGVDGGDMIAYKVGPAAIVKIGSNIDLGLSDFQIFIDGFYGVFTQTTLLTTGGQLNQNFPYFGIEVGVQLPVDL